MSADVDFEGFIQVHMHSHAGAWEREAAHATLIHFNNKSEFAIVNAVDD